MIALPLWIDDNLFVRGLVKATPAVMGGGSGVMGRAKTDRRMHHKCSTFQKINSGNTVALHDKVHFMSYSW